MNTATRALAGAMLAALLPLSAAAAGGKRLLVSLRPGATAAQRAEVLKSLAGAVVETMRTNTDSLQEFEAWVVDVKEGTPAPARAWLPAAFRPMGASGRRDAASILRAARPGIAASEGAIRVEEDVTLNWLAAEQLSMASIQLPSVSGVLGGLPRFKPGGFRPQAKAGEIPWGVDRVHAPAAWDTTQGQGARVAVIDTGIDKNHPDLRGRVDGGYNAVEDSEKAGSHLDDNGHGTHVAGTIGAARDGKGVVGVAPRARLFAVKVLDKDGNGSLSAIVRGIVWCINNRIHVANMSLGAPFNSETVHDAIRYARGRSVVIVAAAGNSDGGPVSYPAAYAKDGEVIAVSASDHDDAVAGFSSVGPEVTFIAPGKDIVSTSLENDYASFSGTSMAAPHVSGLAALAVARGARGIGGPDGVLDVLRSSARKLQGLKPEHQGLGMVDASRVVNR